MPIPSGTAPPGLSAPGLAYFLLIFTGADGGGAIAFFPCIADADPVHGTFPQQYCDDFSNAVTPTLINFLPDSCSIAEAGFYWETTLGMQQGADVFAGGLGIPGTVAGDYWPTQFNALITKTSAASLPNRGRLWVPFVPRSMTEVSATRLTSTGFAVLQTIEALLNVPWSSNGVNFTHAMYDPGTDTLVPIQSTKSHQKLGVMMRRSPHRMRSIPGLKIVPNWDFIP